MKRPRACGLDSASAAAARSTRHAGHAGAAEAGARSLAGRASAHLRPEEGKYDPQRGRNSRSTARGEPRAESQTADGRAMTPTRPQRSRQRQRSPRRRRLGYAVASAGRSTGHSRRWEHGCCFGRRPACSATARSAHADAGGGPAGTCSWRAAGRRSNRAASPAFIEPCVHVSTSIALLVRVWLRVSAQQPHRPPIAHFRNIAWGGDTAPLPLLSIRARKRKWISLAPSGWS